jgi:hypothetical protein
MATIRDPRGPRQDDDNYDNRDRKGYDHPNEDQPHDDEGKCKDGKTPTDKTIQRERKKVCDELKDKAAEVRQWEQSRKGTHQLYNDKKCTFVKTETNYQYYRNIELSLGIELLAVNDGIKDNVTAYKTWNDSLADLLKKVVAAAKDAKTKFADLKEAACKLNTCINDSCQSTQRKILTGESYDNCHDNDNDVEEKCNSKEILSLLEKTPKILFHDMDIIFNSSTRVAGIQVFSNVSTLDPLQKTLQDRSKAFDDFIQDRMKAGSEDLGKSQTELGKAIIELTKSTTGLYFRRADFKGLERATEKLCDCHCRCIRGEAHEGRLDDCKCEICNICEEVKGGVCKPSDNPACGCHDEEPRPEQTQSLTY